MGGEPEPTQAQPATKAFEALLERDHGFGDLLVEVELDSKRHDPSTPPLTSPAARARSGAHGGVRLDRNARGAEETQTEWMSMSMNLTDFESRLRLRNLEKSDFDGVVAIQLRCFPGLKPWTRREFDSQINRFPEGQFGIEIDGQLAASASSLILDYGDYTDWHDWTTISGKGTIKNHDPEGDTLYGIEIQVDPAFRGRKLARRLYDARKELCRSRNLARIIVGGRMPGYGAHAESLTIQEYVEAVTAKRLVDPVLTAQLANGFIVRQLIRDYLPTDEDSAGWATCLEWSNLHYVAPRQGRRRQAIRNVRVGLVQYQMRTIESWDEFAKQARYFVDTASDYRADFLLFPELFTLQLLSLVSKRRPAEEARALAEFTPRYLELFNELAVSYNVNVIGGTQLLIENDRLYNVAYLFRRDGTIEEQRKIHVTPSETHWWGVEGGHDVHVFDTDRGRIAILICYDVEFPELARVIAEKGAQILFVPYNTHDRQGHLRVRLCTQARCIENHLYAVTAGCVGNLPMVENADIHYAQSGVFTPCDVSFARDGIATEASPELETVLVHDLDLEELRRHKQAGTVKNWEDRRRDLYRVAWRGKDGALDV